MTQALQAIDAQDIWTQDDDTCHLNGTARMGDDPRTSVVDTNCRSWDIRNLWICDGSVFPTGWRSQSIPHHTGNRMSHRRSHQELSEQR